MINNTGKIEKGWGHEEIWASNDKYCGKFMHFKPGSSFSMHFHADKDETWYVLSGLFHLHLIDTQDARRYTRVLMAGDTHRNKPFEPHQLVCINEGTVIEVSTPDNKEDNYRIEPGDSQTKVHS
jgi:mannose-6-phosphate isomerase-like protein (cupin superfamily)